MTTLAADVEDLVGRVLVEGLVAELIGSGLVSGDRLAQRVDDAAQNYPSPEREILQAFGRGLRGRPRPVLSLVASTNHDEQPPE